MQLTAEELKLLKSIAK
ncbi:truncated putative phage head tail adapter [Staphylococcus phage tp310-1]|uniref:Truncated putative phage head tail adapter n=1 Tax=Staphylococcus phage tp310-1 TaxID=445515 RepID=A7TWC6_9CAUD|nr:truncated putative phage head tail adapter [Staphylococcus phage tp310-1]ABS87443.1 truncated putative phage head tail adapter [Staphylococcus phage tp310-1]